MSKKNTGYRTEAGPNISGNPDLAVGDVQSRPLPFSARARIIAGSLLASLMGPSNEELDAADNWIDPEGINHYELDIGTGVAARVLNNGDRIDILPVEPEASTTGFADPRHSLISNF